MDYHVHYQGTDLGIISIEELRRRRSAGELTGDILVWRAGMPGWESLDPVLAANPAPRSGPPPVPRSAAAPSQINLTVVWTIVTVFALIAVAVAILAVASGVKFVQQARNQAQTGRSSSEGLEIASKPIVLNTNTTTHSDTKKRARAFRARQWIDGYSERGRHDVVCDPGAAQYLEAWLARTYDHERSMDDAAFQQLEQKLSAEGGCDDPLLLTVTGFNSIELHEKNRRLKKALSQFPNSAHKAYPKFCATVYLAMDSSEKVAELDASAVRLFKECFMDGSFRPEDQPEIAEIMLDSWGYGFFHRKLADLYPIPEAAGKSFQWLALFFQGEYHISEAWKARGGGYADTVTENGSKRFEEELGIARQALTKAWELRPDLPQAANLMIYTSLGDSDLEEMRLWFDRTVAVQIDYKGAWSNMRWGLRPRWYGSHEAILAFGLVALNTGRFDTDVPDQFFNSVRDVESELQLSFGTHIYGRKDIWPNLERMYKGYISEPAKANDQRAWQTSFAVISYLAKKYDVARSQLEALGWKPGSLDGWDRELSLMPLEVAARTGPAGREIDRAESGWQHRNLDEASRHYDAAKAVTNIDERTLSFVLHRSADLKTEQRLRTGEWIAFMPASIDDPSWIFARDKAHLVPESGTLEVASGPDGHLAFSRVRIDGDFELQGEFEVVSSSSSDFQAGIVMGLPDLSRSNWYSFRIKRNGSEGDVVSFANGWGSRQVFKRVKLDPKTNSFKFRFRNQKATAWLNDSEVFREAAVPTQIYLAPGEFFVGLGAFNDMNSTIVRYRNVQVRSLLRGKTAANQ